jgi:hypothetical protein
VSCVVVLCRVCFCHKRAVDHDDDVDVPYWCHADDQLTHQQRHDKATGLLPPAASSGAVAIPPSPTRRHHDERFVAAVSWWWIQPVAKIWTVCWGVYYERQISSYCSCWSTATETLFQLYSPLCIWRITFLNLTQETGSF